MGGLKLLQYERRGEGVVSRCWQREMSEAQILVGIEQLLCVWVTVEDGNNNKLVRTVLLSDFWPPADFLELPYGRKKVILVPQVIYDSTQRKFIILFFSNGHQIFKRNQSNVCKSIWIFGIVKAIVCLGLEVSPTIDSNQYHNSITPMTREPVYDSYGL